MGIDIAWIEDFVALADAGTFSRAAELRHVTQPAFSRRIRALERCVGAALFARSARGARLTPAGEAFRDGAAMAARTLADAGRAACEAAGPHPRTIRFAATHTLSATFFPAWLRLFQRRAPGTAIHLMSDSLQACEAVMLGGDADFLLCHHHDAAPGRLDTPAFRSLRVAEDRLVPMTATDDRGAPLWRLGADDRIPLLAYAPESGLGQAFEAVLGDRDGLNRVFTARLASTLLMSAGERLGIAWLPQSLLDAEPDHGLVRAGPADWDIPIAVRLFRRASRYQPDSETLWRLISRSVD